ncbi:hypothetical protein EDB86DRAFT_3080856 [Lactarius hatsudake]|nr:hypothetical protein EDB86DRAFT_3080856 [Lactarius hatsudake]
MSHGIAAISVTSSQLSMVSHAFTIDLDTFPPLSLDISFALAALASRRHGPPSPLVFALQDTPQHLICRPRIPAPRVLWIPVSLSQVPLSWAVDIYPLGTVYHRVFLYHNERVTKPYGYIYIVDHPSWRTIVPLDEPPANVPQEEDLHAFIALNGDLAPHPAEYPDTISNRLFYRPFRIAASNEA